MSVPRYLEEHADRLRARYLAFIHDLGEQRIDGKSVVEHLDLGDGFSFWWMTRLAEKSPFKSPQLYDCLRLMALEEILVERTPPRLVLQGGGGDLSKAIGTLCRNLKIDFVWYSEGQSRKAWSLRAIYNALPHPLQGLISLRHLAMNWPLRRLERPQWFSDHKAIFFCSYFFHLDLASCAEGRFHSNQWGGMPIYLQQSGRHTNWIHHFLRSPDGVDIQTGLRWLSLFNRDSEKQGCHGFLEMYLSWGVLRRALGKWLRLNIISLRLRKAADAFNPRSSGVRLWPVLKTDWNASLRGSAALSNCLWVELFDAALKGMPHQETGVYLWENQGWEAALLRAWRRHGHGRIIGVPHATVVYWHMNNFDDPRCVDAGRKCAKPMPDQLAINGPMAWNAFVKAGCLPDRFVEVEALRFQYLAEPGFGLSMTGGLGHVARNFPAQGRPRKVLILGDFTVKQTLKMLRCIEDASRLSSARVSLTLKPHPACRIGPPDYPSLSFDVTSSPLAELLPNCDLVFSSNTTSASLESLLAALPVLVYLDDEDFNHSPLRGVEGACFIGTPRELAVALEVDRRYVSVPATEEFFWLDRLMPRWAKVLSVEHRG
jgi:surface carbohydrate biosynthesis protein (TIGR04326 family)